ncbi:hydrogenase maturation peptidase HycI [Candidatus Bathyarchaeota archaeon]|nr:MAG: hydrogenase maturation peptidase HycI [Candidatus Bathyarchaeota archaeon]
MNWEDGDLRSALRSWLRGAERVVVAGIGSPLRRDDYIGVKIVKDLENLRALPRDRILLIECGTVPENFTKTIGNFKPTHILLIDAALLNLPPGSTRLIKPDEIGGIAVSTHTLPLNILCRYLTEVTNAKIALLGVQPKDISLGEGMSEELTKTAARLERLIMDILSML